MVEAATEMSEEELNRQILEQLEARGVVNEEEAIVDRLDPTMGSRSEILPIERKKDGSFSARSSVLSGEDLKVISGFVSKKVQSIGKEILAGHTERNPYEKGNADACTYCAYRKVCHFDASLPGQYRRVLEGMSRDEALEKMKQYQEE